MNNTWYFLRPSHLALASFAILSIFFGQTFVYAASGNTKPKVNAGKDQIVFSGETVNLSGNATDAEGGKLNYLWIHPAKMFSRVDISNADSLSASFVAPNTTKAIKLKIVFSARDQQNAKASDSVFITIKPSLPPVVESTTKINDTGITSCGDYARGHSGISNNDVICQLLSDSQGDPVPSGQDGTSGRDISAFNDDGRKGFSFTKLDARGNVLPSSATQWSCVKDNVTDLIWESKTDDNTLHDKDDSFVWYESDPRIGNGGLPGYERASEYDSSKTDQTCFGFISGINTSYCNTKAFVNRVNSASYCGSNNWRLPTREELNSLVDYETSPKIDTGYFPLIQNNYYWTSVPYAYLNKHVWTISFQYGGGSPWEKHYNYPVVLVHN